jgi:hypothetical protein
MQIQMQDPLPESKSPSGLDQIETGLELGFVLPTKIS